MKKDKKKKSGLLKQLLIIMATAILCFSVIFHISIQSDNLKKGYINGIAKDNEFLVETVTEKLSDCSVENEAVDFLKSLQHLSTRYYFLFSENAVVFERDDNTTSKTGGMSFGELNNYYKSKGADDLSEFLGMIENKQSFSAVLLKDNSIGNEIISVRYVLIDDQMYCVGSSVSQNYMFSLSDIGEIIFLIQISTVLICIILISVVAYVMYLKRDNNKKIKNLENQIQEKNKFLQNQWENSVFNNQDNSGAVNDDITNLYNKQFVDTVVGKLPSKNLDNIGLITVRVNNLSEIMIMNGYLAIKQIYLKIASILKNSVDQKDIVSRINKDLFLIIKLNANQENLITIKDTLLKDLEEIKTVDFSIEFYIYKKSNEIELDTFYKNIISEK